MTCCFLGLGSNLASPQRQLRLALAGLKRLPNTRIHRISNLYFSQPLGAPGQPHYYNVVVSLHTTLPPLQLLKFCHAIERQQQRVRKKKWGPRTLDIDILLYGERTLNTSRLTIPHPHMLLRDFVLIPLLEISPTQRFLDNTPLQSYLASCSPYVIPATN